MPNLDVANYLEEEAGIVGIDPSQGGFVHQYDSEGNHRLLIVDAFGQAGHKWQRGEWVGFKSLATIKTTVTWYCATGYWLGTFSVDEAFKLSTISTRVGFKPSNDA